jgi:hypothetical protein
MWRKNARFPKVQEGPTGKQRGLKLGLVEPGQKLHTEFIGL